MSSPFTFIRENATGGSVRRAGRPNSKLRKCLEDPRLGKISAGKLAKSLGVSKRTAQRATDLILGRTKPKVIITREDRVDDLKNLPDLFTESVDFLSKREQVSTTVIDDARIAFNAEKMNNWPRSPEVARYVEELRK